MFWKATFQNINFVLSTSLSKRIINPLIVYLGHYYLGFFLNIAT